MGVGVTRSGRANSTRHFSSFTHNSFFILFFLSFLVLQFLCSLLVTEQSIYLFFTVRGKKVQHMQQEQLGCHSASIFHRLNFEERF